MLAQDIDPDVTETQLNKTDMYKEFKKEEDEELKK